MQVDTTVLQVVVIWGGSNPQTKIKPPTLGESFTIIETAKDSDAPKTATRNEKYEENNKRKIQKKYCGNKNAKTGTMKFMHAKTLGMRNRTWLGASLVKVF
eukprot:SAG11_NODE_3043_length_2737_cov_9.484458_3_plen_101_part_00